MSKRELLKCQGKQTFSSASLAVAASGRHRHVKKPEVYRCKDCNGFHIGSKPKRTSIKMERIRLLQRQEAEE